MNLSIYKRHYKATIRLGIPIILGQVGIIIVGFADNMMVGHHSTTELAAASFVNNFFNLAFIFGMGFSYGLTPVIGGLFADNRKATAGEVLKNSLLINFLVGITLSLCMLFLLLHIDLLKQPQELLPYILPYYTIQLFSVIFTMLFNSFKQFSDGTTDTLTPMWIILTSSLLNIIGNYILIFGKFGAPELGLTGAGISTLISRIFTFLLFFLLFVRHPKYKDYLKGFRKGKINRSHLSNLARLGLPVGFLMGVETGSFSLSVIMMGWLGSMALAAHQIVIVITTLGFMIYYGIAAAVTIRVSTFKSRNDYSNIRVAAFSGLHLILGTALIVMVVILFFRHQMGYLFTHEVSVTELVALLAFPVILYQLGDGLQILFSNALRGIADVKYMAYMALFCHFGLALPIGYLCGFIWKWGALGIWCGYPVSLTILGLILWRRFNIFTNRSLQTGSRT
ncbi:MAG: MATE family efflux transporter [Tannerellaceae bacterium]|nr:MATE family efflux transporter [Tannerellaceae bacterium]